MTIKRVVSVSQRIYNTENSPEKLETEVSKHFFSLRKKKTLFRAVNRLFWDTVFGPMSRMRCTKKRVFKLGHNTERDEQTDRQTDRQTETYRHTLPALRSRLKQPPFAVIRARKLRLPPRTTAVVGSWSRPP